MGQNSNPSDERNVGTTEQPLIIICCNDKFWREVVKLPDGRQIILEDRYFCWQCMDFHPLV